MLNHQRLRASFCYNHNHFKGFIESCACGPIYDP